MSQQVAVIAKLVAQEGKRAELAAALAPMLEHVESEPGTLRYVLHEDAANADALWFYELYTDDAALGVHGGSDAMKAMGASLAGLLGAKPELFILRPVGGKGA